MSDERDPAIGIVEFDSIVAGITAGDAMVKAAPIGSIYAGTVHPGRYLVLVAGDTASVEVALDAGGAAARDVVFLPDVHQAVVDAIVSGAHTAVFDDDALGIIETDSVAVAVDAADAGVKAAGVTLPAVRLADGLGGKAYVFFGGTIGEVEAAVAGAIDRIGTGERLVARVVIPQLHEEMRHNLAAELRFNPRLVRRPVERGS